ncbi:MAG: 50S ribosomal protein L17 [Planctomycetes bacterium RBG_16_59_8]|nr:MAG: 50S ribosomal protein L17 [Planctomycetes bacterium RBG_16_59_8]
MRHKYAGRKLSRPQSPRKALARNLVTSLFIHGRIVTTVEKAKEFRPVAERLITMAKKGGLSNYRGAIAFIQEKRVVKKLFSDIAQRFTGRNGGYTRIVRLGGNRWDGKGMGKWAARRLGDNGARAIFELIERKPREEELLLAGIGKEPEAKGTKEEKKKKKAEAK